MTQSKPTQLLTELEREPIIFFGCTWSEIVGQLRKAGFIGLLVAMALSTLLVSLSLPFQVIFPVATVTFILSLLALTRFFLKSISRLRAGKPLFYEKHVATHKSGKFIQPKYINYQRERNAKFQK